MAEPRDEIRIRITLIDALTGEPFNFQKMIDEMVEETRQRLLSEGKTTWPNGKLLNGGDNGTETAS